MGKKSGPAAPAPIDPVATAQAQAGVNKEAAITQANLNRIDQNTPQGSITYTQNGVNADGTPRYTQTQRYSDAEQRKYDQANQVSAALNGLAVTNVGRVADAQATPLDMSSAVPRTTSVSKDGVSPVSRVGYSPELRSGIDGYGDVQTRLNYDGLPALPGVGDFSEDAQRVSGAVYNQAKSRLDPQWQQQEGDMRARLAAQGISENSDAYRRELDNMSRSRTDAYNQANFSATQAGGAEQSRLFGLAMGARQQGQNEANTKGAFANEAQDQQFSQARSIADLFNATKQQEFGNDVTSAGFNNQATAQQYNQNAADASFGNTQREAQLNEMAYLRNLPLNEIATLMGTAGGVQGPEFSPVSQVGVAAPDYQGLVTNNYNQQMQAYQQAQQARSQGLGGIFGALGSLGGAAIMASDRRVKTAIKRIGTLANGLATYAFRYIGDAKQRFGVMAQEVLGVVPDAVGYFKDGTMFVNYTKVF